MATQPDFKRHIYKVSKSLKSYDIYTISETPNKVNLLTNIIRIEPYNGFSGASNILEYLRIRDTTNWQKCTQVTGLRKTAIAGVFHGNKLDNGKRSLILFQFNKDRTELVIDIARGYYPFKQGQITNIVNNHNFKY